MVKTALFFLNIHTYKGLGRRHQLYFEAYFNIHSFYLFVLFGPKLL